MTTTDTNISNLIINKLTKAQYNTITPNANELYFITDEVIEASDITDALGYTPQTQLVSGTNIKTINSTSLLGSGNIDTSEIFVATYNTTSFADIKTAYDAGKIIICNRNGAISYLISYQYSSYQNVGICDFARCGGSFIITYSVAYDSGSTTWMSGSKSFVSTSGDTMTGDLVISGSEDNGQGTAYLHPYLQLVQSDLTKGTVPSKPMYWGVEFNDHTNSSVFDETRMGLLECSAQTDGSTVVNLRAYKNEANANISSALRLIINSSGTASCTFPNTTCVDGQWVYSYQEAVGTSGYTIAKNTDKSWTFSNLPAQNCEVIFSYKNGGSVETAIYSSLINNNTLRATGIANQVAYGILPVGSNKQISIRNLNQNNSTTIYTFRIFGYRKLGTNTQ